MLAPLLSAALAPAASAALGTLAAVAAWVLIGARLGRAELTSKSTPPAARPSLDQRDPGDECDRRGAGL